MRKYLKNFLTRPLVLPGNRNSLFPLLSLAYLASSGYLLNPPSLIRHGTSRKFLFHFKKTSIDQERRLEHISRIHYFCLSPRAAHSFGSIISSLALFCKARWTTRPPGFLGQVYSPSSAAGKVSWICNCPSLLIVAMISA